MTVQHDPAAMAEFHFESAQFDAMLETHGTVALLRFATPCACWSDATGQPDPACRLCWPLGFLYDAPVELRVFGPNRRPTRRVDAAGEYEPSDAFFTFPTGVTPPYGSRFVLPTSQPLVHDRLLKGREDVFRYAHVSDVLAAHYIRRVSRVGAPGTYDNERVNLVRGVDYAVDLATREVTWLTSAIPDGTRVVFRLRIAAEWVVWELQDRNEGGLEQPWRALCKRLDFLIHPRGAKPASY